MTNPRKPAAWRSYQRTAFTLFELIVWAVVIIVAFVAAAVTMQNMHEARRRQYQASFIDGVKYAVREGNSGGILCGGNDGFHDGRLLVGDALARNPDMSIQERVQFASQLVAGSSRIETSLAKQVIAALENWSPPLASAAQLDDSR